MDLYLGLLIRSMSTFVLLFILSVSVGANGAGKSVTSKAPSHTSMTPEMKKDVAEMHQKMADCMKTDKSMEECRKDVMTNCPVAEAMGGHCPLMDGMKGMKGKKKGMMTDAKMKSEMMKGAESEQSDSEHEH
jgi:hypothetical protein